MGQENAKLIQVVGRYALYDTIGSGGMASVHLGLLLGPVGFTRVVAIKRLHAQFASDPEFVSMFLDEARLAARVRHPNVVQTLDVVASAGGLFVVMELVQGETLARLLRAVAARNEKVPSKIVGAIAAGALHGLHAAHEARNARGEPLGLVHRDISPQNILIGVDGVARVLDFGVAKAVGRVQQSKVGQIKGKLSYMAPEQLLGDAGRAADIYAASVVLWEALSGKRLFDGEDQAMVLSKLMSRKIVPPSKLNPKLSKEIDAVVMKGLEPEPGDRYATAREMAVAVEAVIGVVTPTELGEWVESVAQEALHGRMRRVEELERVEIGSDTLDVGPPPTPKRPGSLPTVNHRAPSLPPAPKVTRKHAAIIAAPVFALVLVGGVLGSTAQSRVKNVDVPATAEAEPRDLDREADEGWLTMAQAEAIPEPNRRGTFAWRAARPSRWLGPVSVDAARKSTSLASAPVAAPDCATPFTIDGAGIRHPRPECL